MTLSEKYRPMTFDGVVGQDKAIKIITRIMTNGGPGGRAFWLAGQSGTGKTTIGRIMANDFVGSGGIFDINEIVGRQLTPTGLAQIQHSWQFCGNHALIVNESHGLSKPVIEIFLDVLENLKPNVIVIFTTTNDGQDLFEEQLDSIPFDSRCLNIKLVSRGLCDLFAQKAHEIACKEGLNGQPIGEYVKLMKRCRNNLRKALQEIESGAMLES